MPLSHRTRIIATNLDHNERFTQDIQANVKRVMEANSRLTPAEALLEVQKEMLKNNPFVPPPDGRCLINTMLPVELLTHIFRLGVEMDKEEEDDEFEEVTEGQEKKDLEEELESDGDESERELENKQDMGIGGESKGDVMGDVDMDVVEETGDDSEWEDEEPGASTSDTESETDDDEEEEDDEDPHIPFEILVSHVCRHWRDAAVNTPDLWSWIEFVAPPRWDMHKTYLERAKGHPLTLEIDGTRDSDVGSDGDPDHPDYVEGNYSHVEPFYLSKDIEKIFGMLVPVASQWYRVDIVMSTHRDMKYALNMLSQIPEAPALESLHMHDEEVCDRYDDWEVGEFMGSLTLPFHGKAPSLRSIELWGVHLDWDGAVCLLANLKHLNLAYHIDRPSFKAFATFLRNSPNLQFLELDISGPKAVRTPLVPQGYSPPLEGDREKVEEDDPWAWQAYPLEVASLKELSLSGHEPDYAHALAQTFFFPNAKGISLSYPNGDFSETIMAYASPSKRASTRKSMFQIIESLQLLELGYVNPEAQDAMFEALTGLKNLCLGSIEEYDEEEESAIGKVWKALYGNTLEVKKEEGGMSHTQVGETKIPTKLLLPHLSAIQTRGIDGSTMREFVDARKSINLPLKTVMMHSGSDVTDKDERWLRANVEEFDYFSDSDEDDDDMNDEFYDVSIHGDDSELGGSDAEWTDEVEDDDGEEEWTDEE